MPETASFVPPEAVTSPTDSGAETVDNKNTVGNQEASRQAEKFSDKREAVFARLQNSEAASDSYDDLKLADYLDKGRTQEEYEADRAAWEEKCIADRREYAKLTLDMWRKGGIEKLTPEDLAIITEDLTTDLEKSALTDLVLSRHGFKNAQDALRQMKLDSVTVAGETFALKEEKGWEKFIHNPAVREQVTKFIHSPAVREHVTKLGVSSAASLTTAGIITLLGGPVSWGIVGAGLAGGALGRLGGEAIRGLMLNKKVETAPGSGEKEEFKEKAGRDLFELIVSLQASAGEIDKEANELVRTEKMVQLVERANQIESRSKKDFDRLDKNSKRIKSGLSVIGAVGGSLLTSAIVGGAAHQAAEKTSTEGYKRALQAAKEHGVRIFHDSFGAHVTTDPAVGHVCKEATDHAWHAVIENKDIQAATTLAKHAGFKNFDGIFHYFTGQVSHGNYMQETVPMQLPTGELMHIVPVTDISNETITSAVRESIQHAADQITQHALYVELVSSGLAVGGTALAEGVVAYKENKNKKEIEADDKRLISSVDEVTQMLRGKNLLPGVEGGWRTPIGDMPDDPSRREKFFADLADYYHSPLPINPHGLTYDWNETPKALRATIAEKDIDYWHPYARVPGQIRAGEGSIGISNTDGKVPEVAVLGVDYKNNRVAIASEVKPDGAQQIITSITTVPLTEFLRDYRRHSKIRKG